MNNLSIIVALADNHAIGKDGQLLWHLPADMKHFKELTTGHTIIMGRRTYESLPKGALPNRKNIVLTTRADADYPNCLVYSSLDQALHTFNDDELVFIIGGAHVYAETIDIVDKMFITRVHHDFEDADTFFPFINLDDWKETEREEFPADEKNKYAYTFITYVRK